MRGLVVGLIALALLAAGGTAFLAKRFLDNQKQQSEKPVEAARVVAEKLVVVADRDLPAGTIINRGALRWQFWPENQIRSEFVSSVGRDEKLEDKFVGLTVRRGIAAGTPLVDKLFFKRDKPGFLAGALEPGMRAVAIAVTATSGASGFVLPGDRVDVLLTFELQNSGNLSDAQKRAFSNVMLSRTGEIVVENVRVVAVDQKIDDFDEKPLVAKTVTLEVTPKQATMLAVAAAMGPISLALRSRGEDETETDEKRAPFVTDLQVSPTLGGVLGGDRARTQAPRSTGSSGAEQRIKVYRGGSPTAQEFRN